MAKACLVGQLIKLRQREFVVQDELEICTWLKVIISWCSKERVYIHMVK